MPPAPGSDDARLFNGLLARELTEWARARARAGVIPWNILKAWGVSPPRSGL